MTEIERLKNIDVNGAIAKALREQQRRTGCEYFEDHTPNDSQFYDAEGELGAKFLYCPMCGKRLEVGHEAD